MAGVIAEPHPAAEALGSTKLKDVFGFIWRNARPESFRQRFVNWNHRYSTRYFRNSNRPGIRLLVVGAAGAIYFAQNPEAAHDESHTFKGWYKGFKGMVPIQVEADILEANEHKALRAGTGDEGAMAGYKKDLEQFLRFRQKVHAPLLAAAMEGYKLEDYVTLPFGKKIVYAHTAAPGAVQYRRGKELDSNVWQAMIKEMEKPDVPLTSIAKFAALKGAVGMIGKYSYKPAKDIKAAQKEVGQLQHWFIIREVYQAKGFTEEQIKEAMGGDYYGNEVLTNEEVLGYHLHLAINAASACKKALEGGDEKQIRAAVKKEIMG